jgi:hypothetical protein
MRMKIKTELDILCLDHLQEKLLNTIDLWLVDRRGVSIEAVEIFTKTICAEVAINNAVRVYHRDDVEHKVLEKTVRLRTFGEEKLDETVEDVA